MTQAAPALVRKEVVVDAPLEHAFTRFTAGFGDFKPPEHNLLGAARVETIFEPRVGGRSRCASSRRGLIALESNSSTATSIGMAPGGSRCAMASKATTAGRST